MRKKTIEMRRRTYIYLRKWEREKWRKKLRRRRLYKWNKRGVGEEASKLWNRGAAEGLQETQTFWTKIHDERVLAEKEEKKKKGIMTLKGFWRAWHLRFYQGLINIKTRVNQSALLTLIKDTSPPRPRLSSARLLHFVSVFLATSNP